MGSSPTVPILQNKMTTHFLTYGDGLFAKRKRVLATEILNSGYPIEHIYAWDRNNISEFYSQHKKFMDTESCSGRFIWKPYVILKILNRIPYGDFLIYLDSGCSVINKGKRKRDRDLRYDEYFEILNKVKVPILPFCPHWDNEHKYSQKDLPEFILDHFNLNNNAFKNSPAFEAGFLIMEKTDEVISIIEEWLSLMIDNDYFLIKNNISADQGVLNAMWYAKGLSVLFGMDFYGQGPFFAGRYTDIGQKEGWTNESLIID